MKTVGVDEEGEEEEERENVQKDVEYGRVACVRHVRDVLLLISLQVPGFPNRRFFVTPMAFRLSALLISSLPPFFLRFFLSPDFAHFFFFFFLF